MKKKQKLSRREQKDLDKKISQLEHAPDDAMAASRVGYLLHKSDRSEEALSYLMMAFRSFIETGQFSLAVMVADELLSIQENNVEIFHLLARLADEKNIEVPVIKTYKKYKQFHEVPLFEALDEVEFLQLLKSSRYHDVRENTKIIKEGAQDKDVYFIVEGRVRVATAVAGKQEVFQANLEQGAFMGEMAFMSDQRRSATITSDIPCKLLSWEGKEIQKLNEKHPKVAQVLYDAFWERSLSTVLNLSPIFSHLDENSRKNISKKFEVGSFKAKEVVLKEGNNNPEGALFIIKKGEAAVFAKRDSDFKRPKAVLRTGDIFGEYSALSNMPCTATVMARSALTVYMLPRDAFMEVIRNDSEAARILKEISKQRLSEVHLQMPYFQLFHD